MNAINKLLSFLFLFIVFYPFYSCKHEPLSIENFDTICFSRDVLPIFQNSCGKTGCHDGSVEGFDARSYSSIMRSVTPGNANKSEVYNAITSVYINPMPPSPNPPLTKDQRTMIALWINQGAMNTDCTSNTNTGNNGNNQSDSVCFAETILPMLQTSCAVSNCHDPVTHKEGINLSSYSSIMSNSELVVPRNPNNSKAYLVTTTTNIEDRMPPYPRAALTSDQIALFRKWITEGAINSNCSNTSCDTTGTISYATKVWPIIQNNCVGCHNNNFASGGILLNSYSNVYNVANTIRNNIPLLSGVIRQYAGFKSMPPYGSMIDLCKIRTIELWIQQGKLNN